MNFSCYKEDLADALKAVMPAVAVKPQTPILSGVSLKAEGNTLEVQANNYKTGVIAKIPVNTEESGEVVVSGKKFLEFVARMPDRTLTCSVEDNALHVTSGSAHVTLLIMPAADFPKVKRLDTENKIAVKQGVLYDLIRKTVFAADKDTKARPIFTGVNFDFKDNCLTLKATNTHRFTLAKAQVQLDCDPFSFVVPAAALYALLARLDAKDPALAINVSFSGRYVAFAVNNVFMQTRLLEGTFPPTDRIVPTDSTTRVTINVAEFKDAAELVALMAKETQYNTAMLSFTADGLAITAKSNDIGDVTKPVEATVEGVDLNIAFNVSYLTDVLRVVDTQNVNIAFNDKFSPALVTMPGNDDFLYVVTPVRT